MTLRLWQRFKPRLPFEKADPRLRDGRPAAGRGDRRGWSATGSRSIATCSRELSAEFAHRDRRARGARSAARPACQFTIGSPQQLGDVLFDKMGLQGRAQGQVRRLFDRRQRAGAARRARACRSPRLVLEWRQLTKLKSTYTDALQEQINPEHRPRPHQLQPVRRADRAAVVDRPQSAEHPDPHRDRPPDPRRLRRRAGQCHDRRRL